MPCSSQHVDEITSGLASFIGGQTGLVVTVELSVLACGGQFCVHHDACNPLVAVGEGMHFGLIDSVLRVGELRRWLMMRC